MLRSLEGKVMPRILLVEDNEMNRDMLSRRLQRRGYSVVIAHDGEQALSLDYIPEKVIVLGGGVIGVEFASVWRSFGAEVLALTDS